MNVDDSQMQLATPLDINDDATWGLLPLDPGKSEKTIEQSCTHMHGLIARNREEIYDHIRRNEPDLQERLDGMAERMKNMWTNATKDQKATWIELKAQTFGVTEFHTKLLDVISSFESRWIPQERCACPICWEGGQSQKFSNLEDFVNHMKNTHHIGWKNVKDSWCMTFSRALGKMVLRTCLPGNPGKPQLEMMNDGKPVAVRTREKVCQKKKASLIKYMHSLRSLIAPYDQDDLEVYEDEEAGNEEEDGPTKPTGVSFISEAEKVSKVCDSMFQMPTKKVDMKTEEERRAQKSEKKNRTEEWMLQTFLNNTMPNDEVEDIAEAIWRDPREDRRLHKTCLALRAACMNHTLAGNPKDNDKFIKQADALRNRGEWALDKRHTCRRMILTDDMPSWLQPVEAMVSWYKPIWSPEEFNADGSPNLSCYHYRPPGRNSPRTIKRDEATPDATRIYRKFMTNRLAIAKCLKTKNNLSALGLDSIGYLFLKLGAESMIDFIRAVFKECVKAGDVPETWKTSKTVFLYKKGDSSIPSNWRPITITSCLYRLYMAMNATHIQMKMHKQDNIRIFSNSQKGFVAGIPGFMEHAVMTRELMEHAIHRKRDLHMIQIDFTNAFGSVPHGLIAHNMRCMGLPDIQVDTVMNIYEGATTTIVVPTGTSEPINWRSGTVQGCPLSLTLFNICLKSFLRLLEKDEFKQHGFRVLDKYGNEVTSVNVAAYADDLIHC
jgi:hypothetical protein